MNKRIFTLICGALASIAIGPGWSAEIAGYNDIEGSFAEQKIRELVDVQVIDKGNNSKFAPGAPITRGEFITWLVRSNNQLCPDRQVRLAEPGATSSFKDMHGNEPSFRYAQGLKDAGWSIGFEDGTFRPNSPLTREQMIAIKASFDNDKDLSKTYYSEVKHWSDWQSIDKRYFGPMCWEAMFTTPGNWNRTFGPTKSCQPQKSVSKAEAAACVWQVGYPIGKNPGNMRK